jgi:6-phosphogluconolactonase
MDRKVRVKVFETPDKLSAATCELIIELSKDAIAARGRFSLVLSGGHTPEKLYSLLAKPEYANQVEWGKVFIFWGDERCVSLTNKQNNAYMAKSLLLDKIDIPAANIYRIPVNLNPAKAAKKYEETIKEFFGSNPTNFDLVLLGLGENGHTASLFPGTSVVNEYSRWVSEVYIDELKMFRVTMTLPLLNQSRQIVFLVSGSEKKKILKTVLTGSHRNDKYPAQLIKPTNGKLYWFADKDAAGK